MIQRAPVPRTTARTVRRKTKPTHTGDIGNGGYVSHDGGPRMMRSVLKVRSEHGRAIHPTQKPLGILEPLLRYSLAPGGTVLDPFAGSCSTLVAAREAGYHAIGIEADEQMCAKAVERLPPAPLDYWGSDILTAPVRMHSVREVVTDEGLTEGLVLQCRGCCRRWSLGADRDAIEQEPCGATP